MKILVYIAFCFGIISQGFAQDTQSENLFSVKMGSHFKTYAKKADFAYKIRAYQTAENLFTKFINSKLVDTKFQDFKARKLNESIISIDTYFEKPVLLITYASWCIRNEKEINSINALAKEFHNDIDFVILFWDDLNTARKSAKDYNRYINVLYINERENTFSKEVSTLKQTLGFPLTLYIDHEDKVVDISKKTPTKDSHSVSYKNSFNTLLIHANSRKEALANQE